MPTAREFDLVLYGATGFVGSLTAWYLAAAAPAGARIALAGRSPERLAALRSRLAGSNLPGGDWPVLTADAMSETETAELAGRTNAMVTTVGPYLRYGLPLAGACARAGTHYADLTGETLFARECIDRYHSIAAESGARIVNSCGVDSIPSDLSMLALHRRAASDGGTASRGGAASDGAGDLTDATMAVTWRGAMSGGTIDSGRAQQEALARDPKLRALVRDPYALSPDRAREPDLGPQGDRAFGPASGIDPRLRGWVTTFLMAPYNTRVVRRSNALLDWAYGKNLRYREVLCTGHSPAAAAIAAGTAGALAAYEAAGPLLTRGIGKRLFDAAAPAPGTGPGEESRRRGFFTMRTFAKTSTGTAYTAIFAAQGDPGYSATSVMLGESGLALAFDESRLPAVSGVLTPAVALGEVLAERLRAAGMTIEAMKSQSLSRTPHCPLEPRPPFRLSREPAQPTSTEAVCLATYCHLRQNGGMHPVCSGRSRGH